MIGTSEWLRRLRMSANPSMPGSITSRMTRFRDLVGKGLLGCQPIRVKLHLVAGTLEVQADHFGDTGFVFNNGNQGHGSAIRHNSIIGRND